MDDGRYSLYAHIYQNGKLFLLPCDAKRGSEGNMIILKRYLKEIQEKEGILLYSVEDSGYIPNRRVNRILSIINNYNIHAQIVDPHPEVYGYYKSFIPYLNETIEVAEIDVEGLKEYLADARQSLKRCQFDSEEYESLQKNCLDLKERLGQAKEYLDRIHSLYSELCANEK